MTTTIAAWQQEAARLCALHRVPRCANFEEDPSVKRLAATAYFSTVKVSSSLIAKAGEHQRAIIAHELAHIAYGHEFIRHGVKIPLIAIFAYLTIGHPLSNWYFALTVLSALLFMFVLTTVLEVCADAYAVKLAGRESVKRLLGWIMSPDTDFPKDLKVRIRYLVLTRFAGSSKQ